MQTISDDVSTTTYEDEREDSGIHYRQVVDQPVEPTLYLQNSKFHRWEPISEQSDDAG